MRNPQYKYAFVMGLILAVFVATPSSAEPVTVNASAGSVSELTARWLGPSRPEAGEMTAEDRVAAAIRLMISGGQREGFGDSGSYHTQPSQVRNAHMRVLSVPE